MMKTQEGRKKTSLATFLPLTLLQGFERVIQGLHVRGCWVRKGYSRFACERMTLCLSCSLDVGVYSIGGFRGPPRSGVAFPTTSGLYCLEVCFGTPNSTELNNNSTPTRSPTGSLKSDV